MSLIDIAASLSAGFVMLAIVGVAFRLLRGPSAADRVIAIDMLGLLAICVAALTAALAGQRAYLDVAFGIALFGFLVAVAFARLLERAGAKNEEAAR